MSFESSMIDQCIGELYVYSLIDGNGIADTEGTPRDQIIISRRLHNHELVYDPTARYRASWSWKTMTEEYLQFSLCPTLVGVYINPKTARRICVLLDHAWCTAHRHVSHTKSWGWIRVCPA